MESTAMKSNLLFLCILLSLGWAIGGCEVPPPTSVPKEKPFDRLKLSDLEDTSQNQINPDQLMSFRVFTYSIAPGNIDKLRGIYNRLSRTDIRMEDKGAFEANGFSIGVGSVADGAMVARELGKIGAVRVAQSRLLMPPDQIDPISRIFLQGTEVISYATSENNSTKIMPGPGFLGWVMSAGPDPRFRGMSQTKLFPAYWQPGIPDIRLRMGLEPIDYKPVSPSQVVLRVEERGVILLGPTREMSEETTLDKTLFFLPGRRPEIRFFVIICDSVGM
jgi:hypothetical protein